METKNLVKKLKETTKIDTSNMFHISATERLTYKRCRKLWDYTSINRQGLAPAKPAKALAFGTGMHAALEAFYGAKPKGRLEASKEAWNAHVDAVLEEHKASLWEEEIQDWEDQRNLGLLMLKGYNEWSDIQDKEDIKKIISLEQEFNVKIGKAVLTGRIDMIVEDNEGRVWILDHKTIGQRLNETMLPYDAQMLLYYAAFYHITGVKPEGVYYNALLKKAPAEIPILKNGGLSKNKNLATTEEAYRKAIEDNSLNVEDYKDILDELHAKGNMFFNRYRLRYNDNEVQEIENNVIAEIGEMMNNPPIYPNRTRECSYCAFKELCLAESRGDDADYIRSAGYRPRFSKEN